MKRVTSLGMTRRTTRESNSPVPLLVELTDQYVAGEVCFAPVLSRQPCSASDAVTLTSPCVRTPLTTGAPPAAPAVDETTVIARMHTAAPAPSADSSFRQLLNVRIRLPLLPLSSFLCDVSSLIRRESLCIYYPSLSTLIYAKDATATLDKSANYQGGCRGHTGQHWEF